MLADGSQVSLLNPSRWVGDRWFTEFYRGAGLERVQCPQRALFSHTKVQDQRVHCRETTRQIRG